MLERLAASDYEGALLVAQSLLTRDPYDRDALETREMCASELRKLFVSRIGSIERVPRVTRAAAASAERLGFAEGFVLARIDGARSVARIVERAGLPDIDTLRALTELYLQGLVAFE
jgi:hypothetical protein